MAKSKRLCWYGTGVLHIGTCADAWEDKGGCVCEPADAVSYPSGQNIYAAAVKPSRASGWNIKTYFNGVYDSTYDAKARWPFFYVWWRSGGWTGEVRFDLCNGSSVVATRSTRWGPEKITCTPSISSLIVPAKITLENIDPTDLMSALIVKSVPTPISAKMSAPCTQNSGSAVAPAKLFPMDLNLTIDDGKPRYTVLVQTDVSGFISKDITAPIKQWLAIKTLAQLKRISGIKLILDYHGTVEFENASADGRWYDTKKVEKYVPIELPTPGGCTEDTTFTCPDGTVITTGICNTATGVITPTGNVCPPPCEHGAKEYIPCADGTRVMTKICIPPNWYDTKSDCEHCTPSGSRTIICPDGVEMTSHRCVDGVWVAIDNPCHLAITCTPSMSSLTTPANIPFKMPDPADLTSPPTLDISTFDITATISVPCVPAGTPANLFPMGMNLTIDDGISALTGLVSVAKAGIFTVDIVGIIRNWISTKTRAELIDLSDVKLILEYPGKVEFADAASVGVKTETKTVEKWVPIKIPTPGGCTKDTTFTCPDGTVITTGICNTATGVITPTGNVCPVPPAVCFEGAVRDLFTCPDGSRIYLKKCVDGMWVDSGQKCPEVTPPPAGVKSVFTTAPLLARVGKKIQIVGLVFCGKEKVGGEKAWISINGELLTTKNTRNGEATAEWTPVVPGLYTICITVPATSACNASASSCTMMQVVSELSKEEIAAAEEEFERAKERIGEIMERI